MASARIWMNSPSPYCWIAGSQSGLLPRAAPRHDGCEPSGAGADLQHGLAPFESQQVQQELDVARLRVGGGQGLARAVPVAHHGVAVDGPCV